MTTTTNPLAALPRAEAHLIGSIDAATASIGTIGTHTLEDALSRFGASVDACRARLLLGMARVQALAGDLVAQMGAHAEAMYDALDWTGPDELPLVIDPLGQGVPALPLVTAETVPVAPVGEPAKGVDTMDTLAEPSKVPLPGEIDVEGDVDDAERREVAPRAANAFDGLAEALAERARLDPEAPPVIVPAEAVASMVVAACAPVERDDRRPLPALPAQPATVKKPRGKRKGGK